MNFPVGANSIRTVVAEPRTVRIRLSHPDASVRLEEAPLWNPTDWRPIVSRGTPGDRVLPRFGERGDRAFHHFRVANPPNTASRAVACASIVPSTGWAHPMPTPASTKGLTCPVDLRDVVQLGARWLNVNVILRDVLDFGSNQPKAWHTVDGVRYPVGVAQLERLDAIVRTATEAGIAVVVVLNNPVSEALAKNDPLVHPATEVATAPNHLGAFPCSTENGSRAYRAAVEILARRYSRPDRRHGWIHGYIVGNEVQQHSVWYNRGPVAADDFLDEYERTVRITWLAVRGVHPAPKVYVSLDHHWTRMRTGDPLREITGKAVLEGIGHRSRSAGDFDWDVAFHPYPEDLFDPRFWNDRDAPTSFDAGKITFRNLEVLPAWLARRENRCFGRPRRLILSEQGFHAKPGPDGERLQAAALAAAFERVERVGGIDAFLLHRHVSHRGEGGLRLGLRDWDPTSSDPSAPGRAFPSWRVFQAADTKDQANAFRFALDVIGIREWSALDPVRNIPDRAPAPRRDPTVPFDLVESFPTARRVDLLDARLVDVEVDGRRVPAIFQHPRPDVPGDLRYEFVAVSGQRNVLEFGIGFTGPTVNGARFQVLLDGREVFSEVRTAGVIVQRKVALPEGSGQSMVLWLRIDSLGDITHDWCVWVAPRIRR